MRMRMLRAAMAALGLLAAAGAAHQGSFGGRARLTLPRLPGAKRSNE